jgi:serine/threonine-protein kinase HipA
VPPFFAGLLPEGARLVALITRLKTSAADEFSLLVAVGGDTIGDVRVLPEGAAPEEPEPLVRVDR